MEAENSNKRGTKRKVVKNENEEEASLPKKKDQEKGNA